MFEMLKDKTLIFSLILLAILLIVLALLTRVAMKNGVENASRQSPAHFLASDGLKESEPDLEYVDVIVRPLDNEPLVVTGWKIEGGISKTSLPKAVPLFTQGVVNEEVAVVVPREARLIISSGVSPLGVSFRENKCTGLLESFQAFVPPLTPACTDCLSSTTYPEYNLCVQDHKRDADFFSSTWRLYLGSNKELWRNSLEVLKLYNQEGELLDIKSY